MDPRDIVELYNSEVPSYPPQYPGNFEVEHTIVNDLNDLQFVFHFTIDSEELNCLFGISWTYTKMNSSLLSSKYTRSSLGFINFC